MSTTLAARAVSGQRHPAARGSAGWKALAALVATGLVVYLLIPRSHYTLRDRQADFSVRVPSAWEKSHPDRFKWALRRMEGMTPEGIMVIAFFPVPDSTGKPDMKAVQISLKSLQAKSALFVINQSEPVELAGLKGHRLTCTFRMYLGGLPVEPHQVSHVFLWRKDKGFYFIGIDTKYDTWPVYGPDFEEVVASFRASAD